MERNQDVIALVGRICLVLLFIWSGWNKIGGFEGTAGYVGSKGLPMPAVLTALTIVIELGLGLLILIGWQTRWAALLIALWLIPTTLLFHNFWAVPPEQIAAQKINFMKNLSLFGGMLLLMAFGPGRLSVDGRRAVAGGVPAGRV